MKTVLTFLLLTFSLPTIGQVKFKVTAQKPDPKTSPAPPCDPIVDLNGHKGTSTITKNEIQRLGFLKVTNCDSTLFKVVSYELILKIKGNPYSGIGKNASINLFKKMMLDTKPGEKIFIDNIKVEGPDKKLRAAPAVTLIVQ